MGGMRPVWHFPRGCISRNIKKSVCVWSFKCFIALNIRLPEVLYDVQNTPNSLSTWASPQTDAGELSELPGRLGPQGQGGAARRTFAPAPQTFAPPLLCQAHYTTVPTSVTSATNPGRPL